MDFPPGCAPLLRLILNSLGWMDIRNRNQFLQRLFTQYEDANCIVLYCERGEATACPALGILLNLCLR